MKKKSLNSVNITEPNNYVVKTNLVKLAKIEKKNSRFLTRKNVLLGLMASTMVAVPVAVGITQIERSIASYKFDGKSFSSVDSAFDYVKNNSEVQEYQNEGMKSKWYVTMNGVKRSFDTPEALRQYLFANQIQSEKYSTSLNLDNYVDKSTGILGLDDSLWSSMNSGTNANANKETIYEKSNGGFATNSDDAMKSYFSVQDAYYFNNMYFNSKETLRNYLISDYLPNTRGTFNSITIEGPNGVKSNPISLSDTSENGAIKEIKKFIEANAEKVVTYTNSKTQKTVNINRKNIDAVIGEVNVEDLDYQHVQSSQGESRYIIDNSIEDEHNLIGPYFYKGNMDVGSFSNKSMWKKANGVSKQVYESSVIDNLIGTFFTTIINDDNQVNKLETQTNESKPHIFRTLLVTADNQSLDEWYLEQVKAYNADLYNEIVTALNSLMNGKKFNTFYKIPVMYSFIMQRLINMNATNDMIALTIGYFSKVADFIQDSIELSLLDSTLLTRSSDGKKFDVKEFFQIGNNEFDLNTSTEYFLNEFKTYDCLIAGISAYVGAANNINTLAGTLVYSGYNQKYLFDFKIINEDKFYQNYAKFENIFTTFSKTSYDALLTEYIKRTTNSDIVKLQSMINNGSTIASIDAELAKIKTIHGNSAQELIKGVAAKNTYLFALAEEALKAEIDEYISTGKWNASGMLVQLGDVRAKGLVDLYKSTKDDPNFSIYTSYIYALIDFRTGSGVFNTHDSISNEKLYKANVAKVVVFSLASVGGAAYAIESLYRNSLKLQDFVDNFYGPDGLPAKIRSVYDTVKDSIKNKWTTLKNKIPFRFRTWHLYYDGAPTIFKKWSTAGIFKSIGKVGDVFAKAAPFIGLAAAGLEIFTLVYDLIKVTNIQDFYVYTTADGTEFIWDGGLTTSRFFGLEVKQQVGISAMKLVPPVQITKPQITEFYYYNQVKYFDISQLKRDQLLTIISNDEVTLGENFKRSFTFSPDFQNANGSYDTKENLINGVIADIGITKGTNGAYNFTSVNTNSKYVSNTSYVLGNGISSSTGGQNSVIADNIVKNIRPTKVAQLPKITNGKISGKNDQEFVLPGKVWSSEGIVDNSGQAANYITDNSANELKNGTTLPTDGNISSEIFKTPDAAAAANASKDALFEVFKTKAAPNSKTVLKSDILQNNEYTKLNSEIQEKEIFKATLPDQGTVYFTERVNAENWILKNVNFEKYTDVITDASYVYNGMYFASTSELKDWLQSVIVMG